MDLSQIRTGVNLRSHEADTGYFVETLTQRRGFDLNAGDSGIGVYQRYIQAFNLERWLHALDGLTFSTVMSDISPGEARELAECYVTFKGGDESIEPPLSLVDSLQIAVNAVDRGCGVFVKTSSRSAKDFANHERLRAEFLKRLANLKTSQADQEEGVDENTQMIAMSYASMELLRMRSAAQALEIFARSERIWNDMVLALACHDEGAAAAAAAAAGSWEEHAVVRRWVNLEPDMEFRCFVANGNLTAVSQYRHLVYFPRLASNCAAVLSRLVAAFREISPRLEGLFPKNDYVLDLALELQTGEEGAATVVPPITSTEPLAPEAFAAVWAVEVNPFFDTTDGCLHSWTKDLRLLLTPPAEGAPPDFRIRTAPARGASSLLYGDWKEIMRTTPPEELPSEGAAAETRLPVPPP
jgi:hypothetical protein